MVLWNVIVHFSEGLSRCDLACNSHETQRIGSGRFCKERNLSEEQLYIDRKKERKKKARKAGFGVLHSKIVLCYLKYLYMLSLTVHSSFIGFRLPSLLLWSFCCWWSAVRYFCVMSLVLSHLLPLHVATSVSLMFKVPSWRPHLVSF